MTSSIDRAKELLQDYSAECPCRWPNTCKVCNAQVNADIELGDKRTDYLRGYIGAIEVLRCEWDWDNCLAGYAKDKRRTSWCDACRAREEFNKLFPEEVD